MLTLKKRYNFGFYRNDNGQYVTEEMELGRMRWRSRRGLLELDLLLLPFFDEEYRGLPAGEQKTFELLLEQEDPDLLQWFSQKGSSDDPKLAALVKKILDRVQP